MGMDDEANLKCRGKGVQLSEERAGAVMVYDGGCRKASDLASGRRRAQAVAFENTASSYAGSHVGRNCCAGEYQRFATQVLP